MILTLARWLLRFELRRLERRIDRRRFDRILSAKLDRVIAALEAGRALHQAVDARDMGEWRELAPHASRLEEPA